MVTRPYYGIWGEYQLQSLCVCVCVCACVCVCVSVCVMVCVCFHFFLSNNRSLLSISEAIKLKLGGEIENLDPPNNSYEKNYD